MPARSRKKLRKKPAPPQKISPETWQSIKASCVSGISFSEAARAFGIRDVHAIIMRSRRQSWPVPTQIQARAASLQALQTSRYKAQEKARQQKANGEQTIQVLAQDWVSRGETHRALVYELTNAALRQVSKQPPPLEDWSDIERADKAGRRACGLDDSEAVRNVSVGMQLIEFRLANIHLPPDAPEAFKEPPEDASGVVQGQDVTDARL
jgi:hypothetical protein